jgi:ABC-type dipeptide/oligopeptide/nickel transport system ATPase component
MIIGLIGLAGSGKTTSAEYLMENYGFSKINFKDGLIRELKQNFPDMLNEMVISSGDPRVEDVDDLFTLKPPLMRTLMQNYGTEVRRMDNPDYWVDIWVKSISNSWAESVVVDDVRFKNEADAIKLQGGYLIKLNRPDLSPKTNHTSETEQASIIPDCIITCEAGQHDILYKNLDEIISEINGQER